MTKISIIIPTYNEEDVISKCLDSLERQSTNNDFEVIVVDDGSTDSTYKVVSEYQIPNAKCQIKTFRTKHLGAGGARNEGAKIAKGEILVFVDSDMTFDKHFLKMLVKPIIAGKTKGTFSKDEYVSNWDKPLARAYSINEGWENKKRHPRKYPNTQKVFRAILKSEFDRVRGFTPGGYNDDWSLSEKLGYEATVADKAVFFHKNPDSLKEIYNHAKWVGKRKYKYGLIGYLVALVRSSLPVSLTVGLIKSFFTGQPMFLIFKVVYDFGLFIGILKYMTTQIGSK
jgi:glycosyltransferase involved in cell wall biosynthesis